MKNQNSLRAAGQLFSMSDVSCVHSSAQQTLFVLLLASINCNTSSALQFLSAPLSALCILSFLPFPTYFFLGRLWGWRCVPSTHTVNCTELIHVRYHHCWTSAPSFILLDFMFCSRVHVWSFGCQNWDVYIFSVVLLNCLCVADLEVQRMKKAVESLLAANEEKVLQPSLHF